MAITHECARVLNGRNSCRRSSCPVSSAPSGSARGCSNWAGLLVGSDSLPSDRLHHFHVDDVYNPIEPGTLLTRLQTLGFAHITVIMDTHLKFIARKAPADAD